MTAPLSAMIIALFLTALVSVRGAATDPSAASHHGRKAQGTFQGTPGTNGSGWVWAGCGPSQCYRQEFNQCFHATSFECTSMAAAPPPTPPPTPRPVLQWIETENPVLLKMLNVGANYSLTSAERARLLIKIRALLEEALDPNFWEVLSVESPGPYTGSRRLQSSSQRGHLRRRLENTLYLPIVATVRVREDMSDMSRLFIIEALRDKLSLLLLYLKSINANAFRNLQLSWGELNLSDVGEYKLDIQTDIQTTVTKTDTSVKTSTPPPPSGTPFWVWIIVVIVLVAAAICLLLCICKAGWCLCCTNCGERKRKREKADYEMQKQLAIERWRQQPVQKRSDVHERSGGDPLATLAGVSRPGNSNGDRRYEKRGAYESRRRNDGGRARSDRVRRHDDRRRSEGGRRRSGRRHGDRDRTRSEGYVSSGNYQSDRRRPLRPMVKRSLSMIEKEIAQEEMKNIEEGNFEEEVAADPVPSRTTPLTSQNQGQDPPDSYQNALVVYDDEKVRFALDPDAPKVEDLPKPESTAVVLYNAPKEPEGDMAETPRKKSGRSRHYHKDELYVCSIDDLPHDVRVKTRVNQSESEELQDNQRSSRRKRGSYTDTLKKSLAFKWKEVQRNNDDYGDYDGVQASLETESDSESVERTRRKSKKERSKKKKSNKDRSSHDQKRHYDSNRASTDSIAPSIVTAPPEENERDRRRPKSPKSFLSSFRRSSDVSFEESDEHD